MPEDSAQADSLSWFYTLPMDDQVALLSDPHQPLPQHLVDRLSQQLIVGERWVNSNDPIRLNLTEPVARRLRTIRNQLDDWWDQLSHHQHLYLIQQRAGELDATYADTVQPAADALKVELVRDPGKADRFRLPPMIRTYIEMKAR